MYSGFTTVEKRTLIGVNLSTKGDIIMEFLSRVDMDKRLVAARKKADEAIGGTSHECEIGWNVNTTKAFIHSMKKSGAYDVVVDRRA